MPKEVVALCCSYLITAGHNRHIHVARDLDPCGVQMTPAGILLVACNKSHRLYAIDPRVISEAYHCVSHIDLVVGEGRPPIHTSAIPRIRHCDGKAEDAVFDYPADVALDVDKQCAYVVDVGNRMVRRVALPPRYFQMPKPPASAANTQSPETSSSSSSAPATALDPDPAAAAAAAADTASVSASS
jgi:hypothetical protein